MHICMHVSPHHDRSAPDIAYTVMVLAVRARIDRFQVNNPAYQSDVRSFDV